MTSESRALRRIPRYCALALRGAASMLLVSTLWQPVRAEIAPPPGRVDTRIRVAAYDGDQVYRLRGFVGYQIDLEFEPGEWFVGLGAGDIDGLSYVGQDNHLFLKPKAPSVATNLTVLTNRRRYQFDYIAVSQRPGPADADLMYALRFTYPEAAQATAKAARIDAELEQAPGRRLQNLDFWYCGNPTLKPVFASDDGVHTRLRFAANADLPAIFISGDDGESLLNFSMNDGDVVIHRVAPRFILRRGRLTGCIVNRGYAGGGQRLESGTVAPDVERRVRVGVP